MEYPNCFGCGSQNPHGLGLRLELEGERVVAEFTPLPHHQGWPGVVHGGILSSLLYEVMENWGFLNGIVTMAKSMDTRFRRPALIGQPLRAECWLERRDGRTIVVAAMLECSGEKVAEGRASLVEIDSALRARLGIA